MATQRSLAIHENSVYYSDDFDSSTEVRCSECDKLILVRAAKEHLGQCDLKKQFECGECPFACNREVNLSVHQLISHDGSSTLKCSICNKSFKRIASFRAHVLLHSVIDNLNCVVCKQEFATTAELGRHCRLEHSSQSAHTEACMCCRCEEIFSPQELKIHRQKHSYKDIIERKKKVVSKRKPKDTNRPHLCDHCGKAFRRPAELVRHKAVHETTRSYRCHCGITFRHESNLRSHEKTHTQSAPTSHACKLCSATFLSRHNLYRHIEGVHVGSRKERVRRKEVTTKPRALEEENHAMIVQVPQGEVVSNWMGGTPWWGRCLSLPPSECLRPTDRHPPLDDSVHPALYRDIFISSSGKEDNLAPQDGEDAPHLERNSSPLEEGEEAETEEWLCMDEITGEELAEDLFFRKRSPQKDQILVVPEDSIRCPACLHTYSTLEAFAVHFNNISSSDHFHRSITVNCLICKNDILGGEVYEHLGSVHGIRAEEEIPQDIAPPRPHTCAICHKGFTKRFDLVRHESVHTGEKPFCCRFCGIRFRLEGGLKRHEKRHTEELSGESQKCTICGKAFYSRNSLRTHMIQHTSACTFCNLVFQCEAERDAHVSAEHGRETKKDSRKGGFLLPAIPGAISTLQRISRPTARPLRLETSSKSAFAALPAPTPKSSSSHQVQVDTESDSCIRISRGSLAPHPPRSLPPSSSGRMSVPALPSSGVSFTVPRELLNSLQREGAILRTPIAPTQTVALLPEQTLSVLAITRNMQMVAEPPSTGVPAREMHSSSFAPVHLEARSSFVDHCAVCDVSFCSREESDAHLGSEDHETARLLAPVSRGVIMPCKLCGQPFPSMLTLVEHIRRVHERDHPRHLHRQPASFH